MTDFETHPVGTAARIEQLEAALTRANAATAAAYEVAAHEVECGCGAGPCQDTANCAAKDADAIRALATPDQRSALDRLIAEAVEPYVAALIWCSGSADFNEGGVAEKGWQKLCAPLLAASKKGCA